MWGARSKLDAVPCGGIVEKLVPSSDRLRRIVVAVALVAVVAAALSAAGTAAASENGAVYVNEDGFVEFIDQEGTRNATDQQAAVVGTAVDLDDDGNVDAPVVYDNGLKLVRPAGTTEQLVDGGVAEAAIAVDDVDGDGVSDVLYVNSSDGSIWRVSGGGETKESLADVEATAVAGYGDFDGDGADETVFVGPSQRVKYVDDDGSVESTGYGDVAGVGPLANYDGDSGTRVAVVDGSKNSIALIDADGAKTDVGGDAAAAPIGETDLDGGGVSEVVYVDSNSDRLKLVEVGGGSSQVINGSSVSVDESVGAAGGRGIDLTPPPVTVDAPENRTYIQDGKGVPLDVSAKEAVEEWRYSINGDDKGSFNPDEFDRLVLDPGEQYTLTVYAEDPDGNVETVERTFGVGRSGSTAVYVDDRSGHLSYITSDQEREETSVSGEFRAVGPAIHYDADGQLEIPYVKEDGDETDEPPLELYHVADGSTTELEKNAMGGINNGKIATADFDDDGRFDVIYRANGDLRRVDHDEDPQTIVSNESYDTDPQAIFGSADVIGDASREIVWLDASSGVMAVGQSSGTVYGDEDGELSFDTTPGSDSNVGAGEPLPIVRDGPKYFPIVDGSGNPGVLNASDTSYYQQLTDDADANAKKAPVGLADVNGDTYKELLFIDDSGVVKYTRADPQRAPDNEVEELRVEDGGLVEANADVGVVTTHFPQRVNGQYVYPGDETAPSVEILEPADAEYEDEVTLDVRADEPIDEWYYSVDGEETRFDGSRQLLTDLSRGSHTITVRAVNAGGEGGRSSETFRVAGDDPDEAEAAQTTATPTPTATPRRATAPSQTAATATPAPTATPTPTPATAPPATASTPTPTTASNTTSTPTTASTAESTSATATTGAEQAGSLNWVFPLLVLVVIAIAVFAVRQRDREE